MKEMSKEEIYRWAILNTAVTDDLLESGQNAVYSAMDRFAKQEAIIFLKFADKLGYIFNHHTNNWDSYSDMTGKTDDQLYNLYLESKNKKQ